MKRHEIIKALEDLIKNPIAKLGEFEKSKLQNIIDENKEYFEVCSVTRDDVYHALQGCEAYDTAQSLTDEQMARIAKNAGNGLMECGYWDAVYESADNEINL